MPSKSWMLPFTAPSPGVWNVTYLIPFSSGPDIVATDEPSFDAYVVMEQPVLSVLAYTLIYNTLPSPLATATSTRRWSGLPVEWISLICGNLVFEFAVRDSKISKEQTVIRVVHVSVWNMWWFREHDCVEVSAKNERTNERTNELTLHLHWFAHLRYPSWGCRIRTIQLVKTPMKVQVIW